MSTSKTGTTRRKVLKAGAWSVPIVATATAAPALAASTDCTFGLNLSIRAAQAVPAAGVVELDLTAEVTAGTCTAGTAYDQPLTMTFTLDATSYTGQWSVTEWAPGGVVGGMWTPAQGTNGTSTTTVVSAAGFTVGEPWHPSLTCYLTDAGLADPAPVTVGFTGSDGVTGSITPPLT